MKIAKALKFCKKWSKLDNDFFLTVRWTDTKYPEVDAIPLIVNGKQAGYCMVIFSCSVMLGKLLNEIFTMYDADCGIDAYYDMMHHWYSKKPDWKEENSMVQLVGAVKV